MQRPHPSFGRCLSLSCLGVADAVARGCRSVVVAEVAACMVEAAASRVLHHALLHNGKALSILFSTCLFSGLLLPSAAVCRADPRRHYLLPSSETGVTAFFLSIPHGPYFHFWVAAEAPAVSMN